MFGGVWREDPQNLTSIGAMAAAIDLPNGIYGSRVFF